MTYPLFYTFHFYFFGVIAIAAAIVFVTRKNPVAAALWLVTTLFSLAAMYVMLDAPFIGAIQVLVYAGAIMVVFLFVIMLLNLGHPSEIADARGGWGKVAAGLVGIALLAQLLMVGRGGLPDDASITAIRATDDGEVPNVVAGFADALFRESLLAFEIAGVLLLVAIVAAVVLAKPRA